jgi:hypothetical protein
MGGAAQTFAGQHANTAAHQTSGLTLDVRRRARKHIRRIVYEDQNFEAIDRRKFHAKTLNPRSWVFPSADVRFGSEADICIAKRHVRVT